MGGKFSRAPNPCNNKEGKRSGVLAKAKLCLGETHPQSERSGGAGRRRCWQVIDYEMEEGVHEAIYNEVHRKRYNLAEEAPICQGGLRGQFSYTSTSPTAKTVLDGTYNFPPNMDAATRELFKEIAQIQSIVPPNSITGAILRERWQKRWKKVKEDMSLSQYGLHFVHYIAGTDCDYISQFHALCISLTLKKRHCAGAVVKWIISYAGKNVWGAPGL